jgi:hypothetical protein
MVLTELLIPEDAIGGVTTVGARRIGFLSDDHNVEQDGSDLPAEVFEAFAGVDLIVHLGHMGVRDQLARGVLDRLAGHAPILAVRDVSTDLQGQPYVTPAEGDRVRGLTRIIEAGGLRIGAVHNLERPPGPPIPAPAGGIPAFAGLDVRAVLESKFGGPVDVVAYAGTHRPVAVNAGGVLFVNPGSPTWPKGPGRVAAERSLGTVGILEVGAGVASFEIVDLGHLAAAAGRA